MAADGRHAGGEVGRSFTVRVIPAEGEQTELANDLSDLFDAVELAAEWVEREDPRREGATGIAIFELREGETRKVWEYPPAPAERPLARIFGFDPVAWKPAGREYERKRRHPSPAQHRPAAVVAEPGPVERPEPRRTDLPRVPAAVPGPRLPLRALAEAVWADHVSRVFLILAAAGLWLALTLTDPMPLVTLAAACAGLWWRRTARAAMAQRVADDWE